ncbi:TetR family transcriptional regulator [Saccharopolyspora erythraea NRRL 2338]|uniref:Transcriptional regulator, TetR family n=2 Tax=Saccharopolyspora erythraea TaxID=1836 RepID=A4FM43_SACEN|nr:TetR/AcrR family transcriptional regulator [Saccharopolyspora erythraea]EQD84621.1 TetR family transcriptional regulator [Saccharopolyspora erythraea D]PFG98757.1 TetR family transcriptional regulator [Saccharopolyspora erythraea NRRL 2338]QRK88764.1 TetR/AcrR family transcriptional regulator [Saccharopolyspora erythraea]CAM05118.1 transcriptional regulator, TetR family [Saccharopolyspora erythraea NRRL 2338]
MGRPRKFDEGAAVDAAMRVFWVKGYEATSTQDLCECTGLGRGSLYNAFGSKRALYEAALRRYADREFAPVLEILERPGPVKDRLRELMLWVIGLDVADPAHRGCLTINAAVDAAGRTDTVAEFARREFDRLEGILRDLVALGQRTGELSPDRPAEQVARSVQSTYYGLRVLGKVRARDELLDVVEGTLSNL